VHKMARDGAKCRKSDGKAENRWPGGAGDKLQNENDICADAGGWVETMD